MNIRAVADPMEAPAISAATYSHLAPAVPCPRGCKAQHLSSPLGIMTVSYHHYIHRMSRCYTNKLSIPLTQVGESIYVALQTTLWCFLIQQTTGRVPEVLIAPCERYSSGLGSLGKSQDCWCSRRHAGKRRNYGAKKIALYLLDD